MTHTLAGSSWFERSGVPQLWFAADRSPFHAAPDLGSAMISDFDIQMPDGNWAYAAPLGMSNEAPNMRSRATNFWNMNGYSLKPRMLPQVKTRCRLTERIENG